MRKIFSAYNPPEFGSVCSVGDSITVQGLVTSLSVILSGHDDNNMKTLDLDYSEQVRDLYPEMFGRPTKYELEYLQKEYEPVGPSDVPSEQSTSSSATSGSDDSPETKE